VARGRSFDREFDQLVEGIAESGFIPDAVFPDRSSEPLTMNEFLGRFVGCGRPLPTVARRVLSGIYFERLGVSLGEQQLDTYAKAARRMRELRRGESGLRQGRARPG
jgi:hypothetical protein